MDKKIKCPCWGKQSLFRLSASSEVESYGGFCFPVTDFVLPIFREGYWSRTIFSIEKFGSELILSYAKMLLSSAKSTSVKILEASHIYVTYRYITKKFDRKVWAKWVWNIMGNKGKIKVFLVTKNNSYLLYAWTCWL